MDLDLSGFQYVDRMNEPFEAFVALVLLSLLPLFATALTALLRRPGTNLKTRVGKRLRKLPVLKRLNVLGLIVTAAIASPFLIRFDVLFLDELLTLPFGGLFASLSIAFGIALGLLAGSRPRTRTHQLTAAGAVVVAVLAALLFSAQFSDSAGGSSRDGGGIGRPSGPGVGLVTPSTEPTAEPTDEPTDEPSDEPTTAPAPYDANVVQLPTGVYAVATPICVKGYGTTPVAVSMTASGSIQVARADGAAIQVDVIDDLRPCSYPEGDAAAERRAPGAAITQFDGTPFAIEGARPVRVVAELESESGEALSWVWRRVDGTLYTGLIRTDQLRP